MSTTKKVAELITPARLLVGLLIALLGHGVTWPRFPKEIVPGFLCGMRSMCRDARQRIRSPKMCS